MSAKENSDNSYLERIRRGKYSITKNYFEEIREVAQKIAEEKGEYIKIDTNRYLKHPTQKELISAFASRGEKITPRETGDYLEKMGDQLMFVNQKKGYVYIEKVRKLEAA